MGNLGESRLSNIGFTPVLTALRLAALSLLLIYAASSGAFANSKYAAIVVDAKTGKTLFARHADSSRYPASLTKMMTLYVLFEEIERGRFTTSSRLKVSKYAAGRPPSKIGLKAGQTISVDSAIKALAVKSANDVATVVAEAVSGTEAKFARRMTATARSIGMKRTVFRNASGLPDAKQRTTARDMALLGRALQDRFPAYYKYFGTRSFAYGKRRYRNTNRLLGNVSGVDGIKTGYTRASGFNLVTSVNHKGRHIVAVVMGGKTGKSRNAHMRTLIDRHLKRAKRGKRTAPLVAKKAPPPLPRSRPNGTVPASSQSVPVAAAQPKTPSYDKRILQPLDLIALQIEESASEPGLAFYKPANGASDPTANAIAANEQSTLEMQAAELQDKSETKQNAPAEVTATTAQKSRSGDWQVQIAAAPTREGATRLLQQAQAKAGSVLKSAEPVTQPVIKSGETLYRARFAGFSGKSEARAVCASLKRKSINCLAVPN